MKSMPQDRFRNLAFISYLVIAALLSNCTPGGPNPDDYRFDTPSEYFLYVPEGYTEDLRWPVFVGAHGSGGTGRDCWSMWQGYAEHEGYILLCPSLSDEGGGWYQDDGDALVAAILNKIYQEYSIQNRVFIAGFSAGAQFAHGLAFNIPSYVYAVSMLSATNYYPPSPAAANIPFLVTIGDQENAATLRAARGLVANLTDNGNHVEFYILEDVGHFVSQEAIDLTIDFFRRTTDSVY
jgi:poly(3-hydroxybutyrate) depolymerase